MDGRTGRHPSASARTLSELWIRSGRKSHTLLKTIGFRSSIEAAASVAAPAANTSEPLLLIIDLSFLFLAADVAFGSAQLALRAPEAAPSNPYSMLPRRRGATEDGTAETRGEPRREAEERAAEDRLSVSVGVSSSNMLLGFASGFCSGCSRPFSEVGRGVYERSWASSS